MESFDLEVIDCNWRFQDFVLNFFDDYILAVVGIPVDSLPPDLAMTVLFRCLSNPLRG